MGANHLRIHSRRPYHREGHPHQDARFEPLRGF
nr:MAG TPA: hypothetical protein [Caudoviricetes sp.]